MAPRKKIDLIDKSYQLTQFNPLTYILNVGRNNSLLVFDKDAKDKQGKPNPRQRAIRHCPNEASIYVDEQGEHAVIVPIIFHNGFFNTQQHETSTQKFMDSHPKNGKAFGLIDDAKEAAELLVDDELIQDVKVAIRAKVKEEGGIEQLRAVVSVLTSNALAAAKMSVPELKYAANQIVDANLSRFVSKSGEVTIFDDAGIVREAMVQSAFNAGVIEVSPDATKIIWTDTKSVIVLIAAGMDYKEFFADWLATDEGIKVVQEMNKRMK